MHCAKFDWNWLSGSGKEALWILLFIIVYDNKDNRSEKVLWAFGSGELLVSRNNYGKYVESQFTHFGLPFSQCLLFDSIKKATDIIGITIPYMYF